MRAFVFLALISSCLSWNQFAMAADKKAPETKAKAEVPVKSETAVLAAGCFWGTEKFFRKMDGVISTEVGYAGGTTANPTYEQVSGGKTGHAESLRIVFDPKKLSYEKILTQFFKMHDPTTLNRQGNDRGTQYRSAIFYESSEQKTLAENLMKKIEASHAWKRPLTTELKKAGPFYSAEEYHQKYLEKHPGGYDNHYLRNLNF